MQIPVNIRPTIEIIVKHHFWMLAGVVPLIVLPLAWVAAGDLSQKIRAKQSAIDAKLSSVRKVQGIAEHPNEGWTQVLARDTTKVKRDTLAAWQRFYDGQASMRVWPASLGNDFLERASRLAAGGRLPRGLLERYQDDVKNIVRTLPGRMGAANLMPNPTEEEEGPPRPGAAPKPRVGMQGKVRWSEADQQRLYTSFDWQRPPTTVQVQLAQEEIWLYQIFCDVVRGMNEKAAGSYDASIASVEELLVGFPAAEEKPGGSGDARILRVGGGAAPTTGEEGGGQAAAPLVRPSHPRFTGGGGGARPAPAAPAEGEGGGSPDDIYLNWIYVGFDGRPLTAADQRASLANRMIHLVPFRLRVVMDQRRLDDLLVKLAGSPIPIDVRQVRINPGAASKAGGSRDAGGSARRYDMLVELRGTIALAGYPDPKAVLGDLPAAEAGDQQGNADEPKDGEPKAADADGTGEPPAEQPPAPERPANPAPPPAGEPPPPAAANAFWPGSFPGRGPDAKIGAGRHRPWRSGAFREADA